MKIDSALIIQQTSNWVRDIIVKHNICPFAKKELEREMIHYAVIESSDLTAILEAVNIEIIRLDNDPEIGTTLTVLPELSADFELFLDVIDYANDLLEMQGYEGVYQLAHMHPDYLFDGLDENDAANYTNRSPYPVLHLIREDSMAKVLKVYPNPEQIPQRNIDLLREKGVANVKAELEACFKIDK